MKEQNKEEIIVRRAITKKPRKEFIGFMRMFEPIRNLSITMGVTSFIVLSFVFLSIRNFEEAERFSFDNWSKSFIDSNEALAYIEDKNNYESSDENVNKYVVKHSNDYYELGGENFTDVDGLIGSIIDRSSSNDEQGIFYTNTIIDEEDGILESPSVNTGNVGVRKDDSHEVYIGADGKIKYSLYEMIMSYYEPSDGNNKYSIKIGGIEESYNTFDDAFNRYVAINNITFEKITVKKFKEYRYSYDELSHLYDFDPWRVDVNKYIETNHSRIFQKEKNYIEEVIYEKDMWESDLFNDGNYNDACIVWSNEQVPGTSICNPAYKDSEKYESDYGDWTSSSRQTDRRVWKRSGPNPVYFDGINLDVEFKTWLEDIYANILDNYHTKEVWAPLAGNGTKKSAITGFETELFHSKEHLEDAYKSFLWENNYIFHSGQNVFRSKNTSTNLDHFKDKKLSTANLDFRGLKTWFENHMTEESKKRVAGSIAYDTNATYSSVTGFKKEANIIENFNDSNNDFIYMNKKSLNEYFQANMLRDIHGFSVAEEKSITEIWRLDIDRNNSSSVRESNLDRLIAHWRKRILESNN